MSHTLWRHADEAESRTLSGVAAGARGGGAGRIPPAGRILPTSRILLALAALAIGAAPARAGSCEGNFSAQGVALLTALSYKSWVVFPKLDSKTALDRLAGAVLADGYSDMKVDRAFGAISALQDTTGSGLPQTLRIVARKVNGGTRVDALFSVPAGQVTTEELVRAGLCRLIAAAAG